MRLFSRRVPLAAGLVRNADVTDVIERVTEPRRNLEWRPKAENIIETREDRSKAGRETSSITGLIDRCVKEGKRHVNTDCLRGE